MSVLVKLFELCSTQEKVEKGDNSKSIDARVMYLRHDALLYHTLSMDETSSNATLNDPNCNIKTWFKLAKQIMNKSKKVG